MTDPFLAQHQIEAYLFNLGGKLFPISIRDQMVRGQLLVDRAFDAGLINNEARPLLVIGAGAAGATVAMRAAERGVRTLLVEKHTGLFRRQRNCRTRWIDPSQYDYPVDHWRDDRYPVNLRACPLPWRADWAHKLATRWQGEFVRVRRACPWFYFYDRTMPDQPRVVTNHQGDPVGWEVSFTGWLSGTYRFGMIVWTVGFGEERSSTGLDNYQGFDFWQSDKFRSADLGTGLPENQIHVVISGSGDGALQDFLRITTRLDSAKQIYDQCALPDRIAIRLQSAEDAAQRAYQWGCERSHDHDEIGQLHRIHREQVEDALHDPNVRTALDRLIPVPLPQITMIHSCDHFSQAYALNRFLTLLIGEFLRKERGRNDVFRPGWRLDRVEGQVGHTCAGSPIQCLGQPHRLVLVEQPDCRNDPQNSQKDSIDGTNVVIIRHGIAASQLPPFLSDISQPRQLPPYAPIL